MKQQVENKSQDSDVDNSIENIYREMGLNCFSIGGAAEYEKFYRCFSNDRLKKILSTLHYFFIDSFEKMKKILPTKENEVSLKIESSRGLKRTTELTKELQTNLKNSPYSFEINEYYQKLIDECNKFLVDEEYGNSEYEVMILPPNMEKIVLYYTIPIFKPNYVLEKKENFYNDKNDRLLDEETPLAIKFDNGTLDSFGLSKHYVDVLNQRISEITICMKHNAPLAAIFMIGSTLEGLLSAFAEQNKELFSNSKKSPKKNGEVLPLQNWTLANLIDVSSELGFIKEGMEKFVHILRDFRNYIHPRKQVLDNFNPNIDVAKMCLKVLITAIKSCAKKS